MWNKAANTSKQHENAAFFVDGIFPHKLSGPIITATFPFRKQNGGNKTSPNFFFKTVGFHTIFNESSDTSKVPFIGLDNEERIFEKAEIEASIDPSIWRQYLQTRLQPFFDSAFVNIPPSSYTVNVRFVVEIDGRICSAIAINDPGYGLAKVAEGAIRKGPRWKPGEIFEGDVRSYHTQPITFVVEAEECEADTMEALVIGP